MKHSLTLSSLFLASIFLAATSTTAQTLTFEELPVPATGFFNGDVNGAANLRQNFRTIGTRDNFGSEETLQLWGLGGGEFFNGYTEAFGSWNGWSWSNVEDSATAGFLNQYASFPGGGSDGVGGTDSGGNYAIGFSGEAYFNLPSLTELVSVDLANSTYAALSMRDGDQFARKFGGDSGDEEDFFKIDIIGYNQLFTGSDLAGSEVGSVELFLADYRFADNSLDFISDRWNNVDLSSLTGAQSIRFAIESSVGGTPSYVAIDNLSLTTSVPEPASGAFLLGTSLLLLTQRRRR
jgi:hypothetical protein